MQRDDVDTDAIYPAQFLKTTEREGLRSFLFADWVAAGNPLAAFVPASHQTRVLVAGHNFGCGSSREHAVWALADHGIQAILALSFGDIFRNNCISNCIVAATLSSVHHQMVTAALAAMEPPWLAIDMASQTVQLPDGVLLPVELAPGHVSSLLSGVDDISRTLLWQDALTAHEKRLGLTHPWLA
jgi:3-isopropylmalate/(R)-2-methylmalate dehydratase small subunit